MSDRRSSCGQPLLRLLQRYQVHHLTDSQLLERWVARQDEAAFETLVRRHGPTVHGICRRALGNEHDAEDAFQATFLVLARKAPSISRREALASWLFAVAYRLALRARASARKRRAREHEAAVPATAASVEPGWEMRAALDEELNRLPEIYRAAVVLCCLEGRSRAQAADELGCSPGAVKIRLERARTLLRTRLTRRGVAVPVALLSGVLAEPVGAMPLAWAAAAARAGPLFAAGTKMVGVVSAEALSLACGGMAMMALTKCKILAVVLLAFTLTGGATWWSQVEAQQPDGTTTVLPGQPAADKPAAGAPERVVREGEEIVIETTESQTDRPGQTWTDPKNKKTYRVVTAPTTYTLQAVGSQPGHATFSPDKKLIAVTAGDRLRVHDAATGKILWESPLPGGAKVTFAQDGKTVVETIVLDVTTGKQISRAVTAVDAATVATLQKLAASEDAEVRRLANELMKRIGIGQAGKVQVMGGAIAVNILPKGPGGGRTAMPGMPGMPGGQQSQRQTELEQRLDRLIEEIQELRRQVHGKQSGQRAP